MLILNIYLKSLNYKYRMEGYTPVKDVVLESVKILEAHQARIQTLMDGHKNGTLVFDSAQLMDKHLKFEADWIKDLKLILSRSG